MPEPVSRGDTLNFILKRLSDDDFALLQPRLEAARLPVRKTSKLATGRLGTVAASTRRAPHPSAKLERQVLLFVLQLSRPTPNGRSDEIRIVIVGSKVILLMIMFAANFITLVQADATRYGVALFRA